MKKSNIIWWEKTVEYAFVRNILTTAHDAVPLDGDLEEALSDLLLSDGVTVRLIEFKANKSAIEHEKEKFPELKCTPGKFQELLPQKHTNLVELEGSKSHWFIYGDIIKANGSNTFAMYAKPYCKDSEPIKMELPNDIGKIESIKYELLRPYLVELANAKGEQSISSGGLLIAATTQNRVIALSAKEFIAIQDKNNPNNNISNNTASSNTNNTSVRSALRFKKK